MDNLLAALSYYKASLESNMEDEDVGEVLESLERLLAAIR